MKAITFFEEDREPTPNKPNKIITGVVDKNAEIYINRLEQENKQLKEELKNKPDVLDITRYLDIIRTYLKEIDRLQQKIDKSLKYIDEFSYYYADDYGVPMFVIEEEKEETFVKDLLQILGGIENE